MMTSESKNEQITNSKQRTAVWFSTDKKFTQQHNDILEKVNDIIF